MTPVSSRWRFTKGDPKVFFSHRHYLAVGFAKEEVRGSVESLKQSPEINALADSNILIRDFLRNVTSRLDDPKGFDIRDSITMQPRLGLKFTFLFRLAKVRDSPLLLSLFSTPTWLFKFHYQVVAGVSDPTNWYLADLRNLSMSISSTNPYSQSVDMSDDDKGEDNQLEALYAKVGEWQANWETGQVKRGELVDDIEDFLSDFPDRVRQGYFDTALTLLELDDVGDDETYDVRHGR
jgi:hypothetical protein